MGMKNLSCKEGNERAIRNGSTIVLRRMERCMKESATCAAADRKKTWFLCPT